MHVAFDKQED